MVDVNLTAYQNDAALEAAIPANSDEAVDAFMKEIQPGETVNVCQAFSLNDMSQVTLHASDAFGLDTGKHNEIFYTRKFRLRLSRIFYASLYSFRQLPVFCS